MPWFKQPALLGIIVLAATLVLNLSSGNRQLMQLDIRLPIGLMFAVLRRHPDRLRPGNRLERRHVRQSPSASTSTCGAASFSWRLAP